MTQPTGIGGRPLTPAVGVATPELRIARLRGHALRLVWSALVLIGVAGVAGYFFDNLPAGMENWMLLAAAAVVVLLLVVLPYAVWWSRSYTLTTQRIIERRGLVRVQRRELTHVRGYAVHLRRGLIQRIWGAGTLTLSDGVDDPMKLVNIPNVDLVHETLVDQVEVNQILAHRDAAASMSNPPSPSR